MEKDRLVYDRSIAIHRLETTVRFRNNAVPCERAPGSEPADEELGVRDAEMQEEYIKSHAVDMQTALTQPLSKDIGQPRELYEA